MSFEITGRLYKKFDTAQVTEKFKKREFVLEIEDGAYTQHIKFQLTQNNCDKLDPYNEDDQLKVTFSLRGREYTKDGNTTFFTNLDAWRIEGAGGGAQPSAPAQSAAPGSFPTAADEPAANTDGNDLDDLPF